VTTVNICTDSRLAELEKVDVEPNGEHSQHRYNLGSHEHGLATVWMQCETQCGYVFSKACVYHNIMVYEYNPLQLYSIHRFYVRQSLMLNPYTFPVPMSSSYCSHMYPVLTYCSCMFRIRFVLERENPIIIAC